MTELTPHRSSAVPTAENPLPDSASKRGLALLTSWETALQAMEDPNDRAAIKQAMADLQASLTPTNRKDLAAMIEGLSALYPQAATSETDDLIRARAWLADLAEFPSDAIEAACIAWRRSPERWMPTPGQLIEKIRPIVTHRERLLRRAKDVMAEHQTRSRPEPPAKPEPVRAEPDPAVVAGFEDLMASIKPKRMDEA
jgi:hypothetical protein